MVSKPNSSALVRINNLSKDPSTFQWLKAEVCPSPMWQSRTGAPGWEEIFCQYSFRVPDWEWCNYLCHTVSKVTLLLPLEPRERGGGGEHVDKGHPLTWDIGTSLLLAFHRRKRHPLATLNAKDTEKCSFWSGSSVLLFWKGEQIIALSGSSFPQLHSVL